MKQGYIRLLALMLIITILLAGCANDAQLSPENADILLPEPEAKTVRQIMGDSGTNDSIEVTLHYAAQDTLSLSSVTRTLQLKQNESIIEGTLNALMDSASLNGASIADIENVEFGSGIVSVNLSLEAGVNRSDQDYLLLCASIANTLLQFEEVEAVNILTGSRSDPICGLPAGAFVNAQDNIAALYAQIQSESERFPSDNGSLARNVLLYFPSSDGRYVLPEVRELVFTGDDAVSQVIQALSDGPLVRSCSISAIPGNMDFLAKEPEILITDSGERMIELHFSSMLSDYMDFAAIEEWQLYASLTLTLCSFVPEIDALRIVIDGNTAESCMVGNVSVPFENGWMRRSDFSPLIGSSAQLYFAGSAGKLTAIEYPMARHASSSPLALLTELVSASLDGETAPGVFPEGISTNDILGISIDEQTATVNLSGNFYARCQSLSMQQERQMIYAMVNTLTQLSRINAVSFLVEGETIEFLAQNIYLGAQLLPDPGLIQLPEGENAQEIGF